MRHAEFVARSGSIVVIGLGSAGSAAAALLARAGFDVVGFERRPLARAGARWVNGVPRWVFGRAGVAEPSGAECEGHAGAFHLLAGWGPRRVVVEHPDLIDVNMPLFAQRMQAMARAHGARLHERTAVHGWNTKGWVDTARGRMRARAVVVSSGLGAYRRLAPAAAAAALLRPVRGRTVCAAAQAVFELRDARSAHAFFARRGAGLGDVLCFSGVAGPYSIVNVRVASGRVYLLTGSIPSTGHPPGIALLRRFAAEHAWVGRWLRGGAGPIPLGWPSYPGQGRVVLLGDAGCQVHAAHGSGVAVQMVGATLLAEVLSAGGTPVDWARLWRRRLGRVLAGWELVRRALVRVGDASARGLVVAGPRVEPLVRAALEQRGIRWAARRAPTS